MPQEEPKSDLQYKLRPTAGEQAGSATLIVSTESRFLLELATNNRKQGPRQRRQTAKLRSHMQAISGFDEAPRACWVCKAWGIVGTLRSRCNCLYTVAEVAQLLSRRVNLTMPCDRGQVYCMFGCELAISPADDLVWLLSTRQRALECSVHARSTTTPSSTTLGRVGVTVARRRDFQGFLYQAYSGRCSRRYRVWLGN